MKWTLGSGADIDSAEVRLGPQFQTAVALPQPEGAVVFGSAGEAECQRWVARPVVEDRDELASQLTWFGGLRICVMHVHDQRDRAGRTRRVLVDTEGRPTARRPRLVPVTEHVHWFGRIDDTPHD